MALVHGPVRPRMATGFERDVERGAFCVRSCGAEGDDFGVVELVVGVKTFADLTPVPDDDGSDARIGMGERHSFACQG